jgi:hypothetical protein
MTSMLPPTRDLPPGRQAQIRAEVERAVTGRRPMRLVVPVLAGVASVAAVATSVVLLRPAPVTDTTPAVHITTSPMPSTKADFGLSPQEVTAIEQGCAKPEDVSEKLTLHQFGRDEAGRWALLYNNRAAVVCNIDRGGEDYDTNRPGEVVLNWLPGHFSVDADGTRLGGDLHPTIPKMAGVLGLRFIAGRVDSSVARLTYRTEDGRAGEAKIVDGTYVVRVAYPSTWDPNAVPRTTELRAYDAAGNLLGTSADLAATCYYVPDSKEIIHGERGVTPDRCKPATPWR